MPDEARSETGGPGTLIVVVGPSGAGKDSVMGYARRQFSADPAVRFVRRAITRAADAGSEDHESLSDLDFEARLEAGAFAVHWEAHGLKYGIPADVRDDIARGHVAIANGSRAALQLFMQAFPRMTVVHITASPDVLAARLAARGRESAEDIARRLTRSTDPVVCGPDGVVIDNSGALEIAGQRFVDLIERLLAPTGREPAITDTDPHEQQP